MDSRNAYKEIAYSRRGAEPSATPVRSVAERVTNTVRRVVQRERDPVSTEELHDYLTLGTLPDTDPLAAIREQVTTMLYDATRPFLRMLGGNREHPAYLAFNVFLNQANVRMEHGFKPALISKELRRRHGV